MSVGYLYKGYFNYYKAGEKGIKTHNFNSKTERQVNELRRSFNVTGYTYIGEKISKYVDPSHKQ